MIIIMYEGVVKIVEIEKEKKTDYELTEIVKSCADYLFL